MLEPYFVGSPVIEVIQTILCIAILTIAALVDITTRKIPNYITFTAFFFGLAWTVLLDPSSIPIKAVATILLFCFGSLGLIGMGDVKLVMALSMSWNPIFALTVTVMASALVFLIDIIRHPAKGEHVILTAILYLQGHLQPKDKSSTNSVPFAPYLLIAYILFEGGIILWHIFF